MDIGKVEATEEVSAVLESEARCPGAQWGRLITLLRDSYPTTVPDCALAVDVKLMSGDGTVFGSHRKNLETFSIGFPVGSTTTTDEVVGLEEEEAVLRLLLQFMHNARHPSLDEVQFSILAPFAEAVEKYTICAAIHTCQAGMEYVHPSSGLSLESTHQHHFYRKRIQSHPVDVFLYAAKYNYWPLADKAAKVTLSPKSTDAFLYPVGEDKLTKALHFQWVSSVAFNRRNNTVVMNDHDQYRYQEKWTGVLIRSVLAQPRCGMQHKGGLLSCELWSPFHYNVIMDIGKDLTDLEQIGVIRDRHLKLLETCKYCLKRSELWMYQIQREVRDLAFSQCWCNPIFRIVYFEMRKKNEPCMNDFGIHPTKISLLFLPKTQECCRSMPCEGFLAGRPLHVGSCRHVSKADIVQTNRRCLSVRTKSQLGRLFSPSIGKNQLLGFQDDSSEFLF